MFYKFEKPSSKQPNTPTSKSPSSQASTSKKYVINEKDRAKLSTGLIKTFKNEAMRVKKINGQLTIKIPQSVYSNEQDVILDYEDMLDWCFQKEIGTSHISIFMK